MQVSGGRRPVSGLVYATDVVLDDHAGVRPERALARAARRRAGVPGDFAGWDPATQLAVLRVARPGRAADRRAAAEPRASAIWRSRSPDRGATPSPPRPAWYRSSADRWRPAGAARSSASSARQRRCTKASPAARSSTPRRAPRRARPRSRSAARRRDSGRHGLDGGGDAAGARQPEARISWDRRRSR